MLAAMRKRQERQHIYTKIRQLREKRMLQQAFMLWGQHKDEGEETTPRLSEGEHLYA